MPVASIFLKNVGIMDVISHSCGANFVLVCAMCMYIVNIPPSLQHPKGEEGGEDRVVYKLGFKWRYGAVQNGG